MDIHSDDREVYEAPVLDEIGEFTVMTRFGAGGAFDRFDYFG